MKKSLLILLFTGLITVTACSDDNIKGEQGAPQSNTDNKNHEAAEPADDDKSTKETEATETTSEDDATDEGEQADEKETVEWNKDYLTNNHQVIANEITNLSEKEVRSKWGKPTRTEEIQFRYAGTSKFVPAAVHYYQNEKYAVTFVEGKAARLVYSVIDDGILFEDEEKTKALELAGLPTDIEVTTDTDTAFVYNDIGGVYEVTMFSKGEFVDYLYIILDEAYK
jgi:hypothetical protein